LIKWKNDLKAILVQSPEPIDWKRTSLQVLSARQKELQKRIPGSVKLAEVAFGTSQPNEEAITLLLQEDTDLSGYRLEYWYIPKEPDSVPGWETYYTFTNEEPLVAGSRVRIHAGNQKSAPPQEEGVKQRFAAKKGETGERHLTAKEGARLRLVALDGRTGHERDFLRDKGADNQYNPVNKALLMRKRDGTNFFLVIQPAAFGSQTPGTYRLSFTYRRDNRDKDVHSQVLSQAGSSEPEHVVIDIS
jgi:hypothetical protein